MASSPTWMKRKRGRGKCRHSSNHRLRQWELRKLASRIAQKARMFDSLAELYAAWKKNR